MRLARRTFIRQVGPMKWGARTAMLQFRKRVLRRDTRLLLPTGLRIVLPRSSQSAAEVYVTNADIDWGAEALFASFADPHRDFLDIGAHIGYYSAYLSPRVRRAYAFEPDLRSAPWLRVNAGIAGNVDVIEMAVSSRDGVAPLHVGGGSAIARLDWETGDPTVDVPTVRIDTFCMTHPGVDPALVKTDVEGHDLEALRGMTSTVARSAPLILTECGSHEGLVALCDEWGYTIFAFVRDRESMVVTFRRMGRGDFQKFWFKMLFAVPPHLEAALAARLTAA
jgi:FkbM family methyltransferase